jgi:tripartite-type tricarboxylate transporter receptor subunit TctC
VRLLAVLLCIACAGAAAQGFPAKPVRLVVPVPPGGVQDTLARAIGNELGRVWAQPLIVDNRPGATGIIAAEIVAKAPPDGYTLFMTDNVTWMTNQFLRTRLPYDAVKDFTTVIGLVRSGNILVAANALPASNLQELLALARAKPGELNYGSFGLGSSPHVDTEAISAMTGVKLTHVPYKGGPDILKALLAGEIAFSITGLQPALPLIRQGRVKAIAFGGLERSSTLPDVPTMSESGLPGFESGAWFGWLAHSAVPPAIVGKVAADVGAIVSAPEFREKYVSGVGFELLNLPPDRFAELMRATRAVYETRLRNLNLKLD